MDLVNNLSLPRYNAELSQLKTVEKGTALDLFPNGNAVRESTSIVSYMKAIDVWMVGCIFFVFVTLVQLTLYIWLRATKEEYVKKPDEKRNVAPSSDNSEIDNHKSERSYALQHQHEKEEIQISSNLNKRCYSKPNRYIQTVSSCLFPYLLFILQLLVMTVIQGGLFPLGC